MNGESAAKVATRARAALDTHGLGPAVEGFRAALRIDPRNVKALSQLGIHLREEIADSEWAALLSLAEDGSLPNGQRQAVLNALTQVSDGRGDYAAAADYAERANSLAPLTRPGTCYDAAAHAAFVDWTISTFTPELFERHRGLGIENDRPAFIVGLPRSGTTLLEQILSSHSRVFGAGELQLAWEGFTEFGLSRISEAAFGHLCKLTDLNPAAARVVDKMPANYLYLGWLQLLFPIARFFHCTRDLRDTATSCWLTQFKNVEWTNSFADITAHFRQYVRLMDHWRRVLPYPVLEVDYADVVADLEGAARKAVKWLGLDWEPACLDFHRNPRPVKTASVSQVRRPLHSRSVGRWRNYDLHLQPLFAALPGGG